MYGKKFVKKVPKFKTRSFKRKGPYKTKYSRNEKRYASNLMLKQYQGVGFPMAMWKKLQYGEIGCTISSSGGGIGNWLWAANGMFDPNLTGSGGQPRYYDTFLGDVNTTSPYRRYQVFGCLVEAFFSQASHAGYILQCRHASPHSQVPGTIDEAISRKADCIVRRISAAGNDGDKVVIRKYWTCAHAYGLSRQKYEIMDGTSAYYNANPSTLVNVSTMYKPWAAETASCKVDVRITYFAKLYQLNDVVES